MIDVRSAVQKHERAKFHLEEASGKFRAWRAEGNYSLEHVRHPHLALDEYFLAVEAPLGSEFSLSVGDFLSNAQDSLDHLAWQLFLEGGGVARSREASHVYFPVLDTQKESSDKKWDALVEYKIPTLWSAASQVLRRLQDDHQVDPDNTLWMLKAMANSQKHRAIHLAALSPNGEISLEWPDLPIGYSVEVRFARRSPILESKTAYPLYSMHVFHVDDLLQSPVSWEEVPLPAILKPPVIQFGLTDEISQIDLGHLYVMSSRVADVIKVVSNMEGLGALD